MSRASGKNRRSMAEINVVPYIDVMLVLLIIFMVTAPLLNQGVEVDLPAAPSNPLDSDGPDPIVVSVDVEGEMYLSISADPEASISAGAMIDQVKAALQKEANRPVLIRGDANGPYDNVVRVLVLLQRAEVNSVGLVTDPEEVK